MWQQVVPVVTVETETTGLATSPALGIATERAAQATAAAPLNPWELILQSGPVVTAVLIILLVASVLCWAIVVAKAVQLGVSRLRSRAFFEQLRLAQDDKDATAVAMRAGAQSPHARLWLAVRHERHVRPAEAGRTPGGTDEGPIKRLERTLAKAVDMEVARMEGWLTVLASIGSAAPFIGLFGTVWGIMSSFIEIGAQQSASLAVVAPGIAEALIATAVGLAAAIPAVVAYNAFVRRIRVWNEELASFAAELVNQEDARRGTPAAGTRT